MSPNRAQEFGPEANMTLPDVQRIWDQGVARTVAHAYAHSAFYQRMLDAASLTPDDIVCVRDLAKLPFTSKDDFVDGTGPFTCVPPEAVVDIATTSGTTGEPTLFPVTSADIDRLALNEYLCFKGVGLGPSDTVLLAVTMDRCFMAGLAYFEGLKMIGAATVRVGSGPPGMLASFLQRLQPTAIVSVPSFLRKVGLYADDHGIDLRTSSVAKLVCIGEPLRQRDLSINTLGAQVEELWGARVYSTYGTTELGTSFCECDAGCGGHCHPTLIYPEIVDDDGNPVPDGEEGEVVATTFGVQGMPLIRFRTGDRSFMVSEQCDCGLWTPRLGPILGRRSQMMKIKGTSVYPAAVQRVLDGMEDVVDYVMEVTAPNELSDELAVIAVVRGEPEAARARVADRLQAELKVRPGVRVTDMAELERLQGVRTLRKKRVFIDRRQEAAL
ncbi:MAG: phenylacetate--CoA ligase [bacterium]|nr:phenylacetate--CoA ligase [bacterium]